VDSGPVTALSLAEAAVSLALDPYFLDTAPEIPAQEVRR
jgi:hypothetical protein